MKQKKIVLLAFLFSFLVLIFTTNMAGKKSAGASDVAVTPFPYSQIIPLSFVLLNEMICVGMLFPVVGFLVAYLRNIAVEESGYFSGMLLGVFMLGQICSAKIWGKLSDVYGRRFPLIIGLCASGFFMLLFGLSGSFLGCAVCRFFQGLFNGNVLVAKTMVADVTDKTNQAKGFAITGFTYGIGLIIGPSLGGLLYDPVNNLKWLDLSEGSIWSRRPALLPALVIFVYSMFGMVICTIFIKESNLKAKPLPKYIRYAFFCFWGDVKFFSPRAPVITTSVVVESATDGKNEVSESREDEVNDGENMHLFPHVSEDNRISEIEEYIVLSTQDSFSSPPETHSTTVAAEDDDLQRFGYRQAFQHKETRFMLILYMLFASADTLVNETVPLWVIASKESGGFGLSSPQVGLLLLANGIPCVTSTLMFPFMCSIYADKAGLFRISILLYSLSIIILPLTYYLPYSFLSISVLILCQGTRQLLVSWCFSLCTMLTARSAPVKFMGATMGISQSCCAICRALVPFVFTPIFAFSISGHHIFPFNHCLTFFFAAAATLFCWLTMYRVTTTEECKICVLEGGYKTAFTRLMQGASSLLSST